MFATLYGVGSPSSHQGGESFVTRAYNRLIEARAAQAEKYINTYLHSQSDATLKTLGLSEEEIRRFRSERSSH